jgi:site-specific DNA-methyltransferase (adenine-specific)
MIKGSKSLTSFKQALFFKEIGFNIYDVMVYEKAGTAPPHKNRYFSAFEYMFILSKGKPKTINLIRDKPNKWAGTETFGSVTRREQDGTLTNKGRKKINEFGVRTNIWRYSNGKGFSTKDEIAYQHPAIFPEELAKDHIISWSNEGDIVFDPFMGSGTTAKMATLNNRKWLGFEISSEYIEIANKRLGNIV